MKIGGLQKFSLIDYPGRISAIVFTQGCNFRCPYCHNPELVDPAQYGPILPEAEVISFLKKRRGKLDAVTLTGGEPTLQPDIDRFLEEIKGMGYLTKVDTNGSNPDVLERLIQGRLVDYLAMDVKGPLQKYGQIAGTEVETRKIRKSIALIANSEIDHEYVLQTFVPVKTLCREFLAEASYSPEDFSAVQKCLAGKHPRIVLR
jgi:pyruvate formate lyase activating enzyme